MLQNLKLEDFTPCLHQDFVLHDDDTTQVLTLIDAQPSKYPRYRPSWQSVADDTLSRAPFWLLFRGPAEVALPQRMYTLKNVTLGVIENLFITPVGIDARGRYYEAVFN